MFLCTLALPKVAIPTSVHVIVLPACMHESILFVVAGRTKDIWPLASQAHQVAANLVITGFSGLPNFGHHGLALLLELGVNQADSHVLRHLVNWNELSCDGGNHNLAVLRCSRPVHHQTLSVVFYHT